MKKTREATVKGTFQIEDWNDKKAMKYVEENFFFDQVAEYKRLKSIKNKFKFLMHHDRGYIDPRTHQFLTYDREYCFCFAYLSF